MENHHIFHDGYLDGLLIEKAATAVFLSVDDGRAFVLAAGGVVALAADGFMAGNIILDVLVKDTSEISLEDIAEVYRIVQMHPENKSQMLLDKARERRLVFVEINPSYGASCLILAQSVEVLPREEWKMRWVGAGGSHGQ